MAKTRRPSLTIPPANVAADQPGTPGWVYRTDAAVAASPVNTPPAAAIPANAGSIHVDVPLADVNTSITRRPRRGSTLDRGLSGASLPFAIALVAVLQPLSWFSGGARRL